MWCIRRFVLPSVLLLMFGFGAVPADGYTKIPLNRLCSSSSLKNIFDMLLDYTPEVLFNDPNRSTGALVVGTWNATHSKTRKCIFRVDASRYQNGASDTRGLFASVRHMRLRRNALTDVCIDSVSFIQQPHRDAVKMCGNYRATAGYNGGDVSRFMDIPSGELLVEVIIGELRDQQTVELELLFTVYDVECNGYNDTMCEPHKCIARQFKDDGLVNCSPASCADEAKCTQDIPVFMQQPISATHIAFSAITSLLLTMICVMCVYLCCKCKYDRRLPGNASSAGESMFGRRAAATAASAGGAASDSEFQNIELPDREHSAEVRASAPDDKDMPPSYESLFKKTDGNVISV